MGMQLITKESDMNISIMPCETPHLQAPHSSPTTPRSLRRPPSPCPSPSGGATPCRKLDMQLSGASEGEGDPCSPMSVSFARGETTPIHPADHSETLVTAAGTSVRAMDDEPQSGNTFPRETRRSVGLKTACDPFALLDPHSSTAAPPRSRPPRYKPAASVQRPSMENKSAVVKLRQIYGEVMADAFLLTSRGEIPFTDQIVGRLSKLARSSARRSPSDATARGIRELPVGSTERTSFEEEEEEERIAVEADDIADDNDDDVGGVGYDEENVEAIDRNNIQMKYVGSPRTPSLLPTTTVAPASYPPPPQSVNHIREQHNEVFLRSADVFASESELSARVKEWTERIEPRLTAMESRRPFDLHGDCIPFHRSQCYCN